ncbi:hypothetical protein [Streptomyces humicola]|nr:hypothetical protein [Streptomyces humicola]
MPARPALEAVLEPADAAPHFAGVQALMSRQEVGRLAADGD